MQVLPVFGLLWIFRHAVIGSGSSTYDPLDPLVCHKACNESYVTGYESKIKYAAVMCVPVAQYKQQRIRYDPLLASTSAYLVSVFTAVGATEIFSCCVHPLPALIVISSST